MAPRDFARQHSADRAMDIAYRHLEFHASPVLDGLARLIDQLVIQSLLETVILRDHTAPPDATRYLRVVKNGRKIQPASLPMIDGLAHFDAVHAAHHLVHVTEAQLR